MSDDLISRKAVLKELREIMDEPHNVMFLMGIGAATAIIEHMETAFDKEQVIEELKNLSKDSREYWNQFQDESAFGEFIAYKKAIEIIESDVDTKRRDVVEHKQKDTGGVPKQESRDQRDSI